jgi:hypothetical protein
VLIRHRVDSRPEPLDLTSESTRALVRHPRAYSPEGHGWSSGTPRVLARHQANGHRESHGSSADIPRAVAGTQAGNRPTVITHSSEAARVVVRYFTRHGAKPRGYLPGATRAHVSSYAADSQASH